MAEPELIFEVRERAAWLTINREARRNAINGEVIRLFGEALDRVEADHEIRAICLTGAGDRAFCAGADLQGNLDKGGANSPLRAYAALLTRLATFPKPLVAHVNGHCMAGGLGLLLSCDIAYARSGIKVGTPEVSVGLFPMMIAALITRDGLRKKVLEMIYTARSYSAEQAEAMGLLTRVVAADQLLATTQAALRDISRNAPLAISLGRRAMAEVASMDLPAALDRLCTHLEEVLKSEDAKEGLAAFVQKREPQWTGR